jgi:hypothetical protein
MTEKTYQVGDVADRTHEIVTLYAFEVWFKGWEHERAVINHESLGKARAALWNRSRDCAPSNLRFVDVCGRKLGPPQDTETLRRVQEYRGRPDLTAGTRVQVENSRHGEGVIVDAGAGCNFLVHFDDGSRLFAHPLEIESAHAANNTENAARMFAEQEAACRS